MIEDFVSIHTECRVNYLFSLHVQETAIFYNFMDSTPEYRQQPESLISQPHTFLE